MKTRMVLLATLALTIAPTFAQQQADDPVRWYRLAAEQGHVDAQFSLGMRYLEGRDVQVDVGEARKWLEAAAMQGHAEAQFQLANLLSRDSAPASPPKPTIAPAPPPPKIVSPPVAKPEPSPAIAPCTPTRSCDGAKFVYRAGRPQAVRLCKSPDGHKRSMGKKARHAKTR